MSIRNTTRRIASRSAALSVFVRDTASGFLTTARHTLMILGIGAIAALALMFFKPDVTDHLKALSPFADANAEEADGATPPLANLMDATASPAAATAMAAAAPQTAPFSAQALKAAPNKLIGTDLQQQRVTQWLSKRYRVAGDATNMLVSAAYLTAKEISLDPLLILAVMAIESRFNPFAESPVGAQGLMQVMSKVHHDKFEDLGGVRAALNPVANIKVGSVILKEYVARDGSIEAGLKRYVGAAGLDTDFGYAAKVLGEYDRLKAVANGKRVSVYAAMSSRPPKADAVLGKKAEEKPAELTEAKADVEVQARKGGGDQIAAL
jgi:soluble lytic murein transglycosylase-like protein